jgi:hypothetical protein
MPGPPTSFWVLPDWFEDAKRLYPHAVKFEIKDENTIFEAYTWCRNRLGPPARMTDDFIVRPRGVWVTCGIKTNQPQIWFQNEEDASLFRVFFG